MNTDINTQDSHGKMDRLGAVASTACALHCAAGLLLPASAILGLGMIMSHEAEWVLSIIAVVIALIALVLGWRQHGKAMVLVPLAIGIIGLMAARGLEGGEHHGDHQGEHEEKTEHGGTHDDHSEEEGGHDEHHSDGHLLAEALGIGSGFILVFGHIVNLRALRRKTGDAADADCCDDD